MKPQPFIQCENLVKIYRIDAGEDSSKSSVEVQALQGLDFTVTKGEIVGVVGASGSGKSTLLNILGGLDRPTGGRALVMGRDLGAMSAQELDRYRTQSVGFVWQYGARNLIPYLSAYENIELPMLLSGKANAANRKRALELLDVVGLSDRKEHRLEELSGGEQQRVAVAIALANQPALLLADEPTGELDTATAKTIYDLFQKLNRQLGLTVVIVSHDAGIASHVDRVVAVRDGKLASETLRIPNSEAGHVLEELLVLDSAGRISIPREYLDRFHFRRHVRMEVTEDGIHLRPISDHETEHAPARHAPGAETGTPEEKRLEEIQHLPQRLQGMLKKLAAKFGGKRGGTDER